MGEIDENMQLKVLNQGAVDYGDFFASQIAFSPDGRAIMFGWLREDPRRGLLTDGEWAGTQAIPRVVSVNEKNEMDHFCSFGRNPDVIFVWMYSQ